MSSTPLLEVFLAYLVVWRLKTLHFLYLESAFFIIFFVRTEVMKSFSHFASFFFFFPSPFPLHIAVLCLSTDAATVLNIATAGHFHSAEDRAKNYLGMLWRMKYCKCTEWHFYTCFPLFRHHIPAKTKLCDVWERRKGKVTLEKRKTFRRDCCLYNKLLISFQDGLLLAHE